MKSKSPLERTIANTAMTFACTTLVFTFFAGLQLLGVPVPAYFRYSPWFWLPMVGSAVFSIVFVALFDAKGPSISEDWLDWIVRDDGTKESSANGGFPRSFALRLRSLRSLRSDDIATALRAYAQESIAPISWTSS